jgi:hypothetical protein
MSAMSDRGRRRARPTPSNIIPFPIHRAERTVPPDRTAEAMVAFLCQPDLVQALTLLDRLPPYECEVCLGFLEARCAR